MKDKLLGVLWGIAGIALVAGVVMVSKSGRESFLVDDTNYGLRYAGIAAIVIAVAAVIAGAIVAVTMRRKQETSRP